MSMAKRKGQPTDPTERALDAAAECRAATRESHEATQGLIEAAAGLRAAIAEGQRFIQTQAAAVQEVHARVAEAEAHLRRLEAAIPVSKAQDDDTKDVLRCPHCECMIVNSESIDGDNGKPHVGAVSVCARCSKPSFFALSSVSGELSLRKPTTVEARRLARSAQLRKAKRHVKEESL